jgi:hypothetical protein
LRESLAVQLTLVEPSGKVAPEAGVQDTVTGARPPDTVGAGNATCVVLEVVLAAMLAGHAMVGAAATSPLPPPPGLVGDVGVSDPPHPRVRATTRNNKNRAGIS